MVAAFALEIEHGVDHVLDDARAGDLAVLGDVADEARSPRPSAWRSGSSPAPTARTWVTVPGAEFGDVGPQRLDRIEDDEVRPLAVGERREDVLDVGLGGELHRRVGERRAARARSRICATASSPET